MIDVCALEGDGVRRLYSPRSRSRCAIDLDSIPHQMGSTVMSDQDDWDFASADDAKAEIRVAVGYLLKGASGPARNIVELEILKIVHQVANGLPPEQPNPLDDGLPGG
jgi:hypothetical protein